MKKGYESEVVLQKVLLHTSDNPLLYYRTSKNVAVAQEGLKCYRDGELSTDTYFNTFAIGKWRKYCKVNCFYLLLSYQGMYRVEIIHSKRVENLVTRKSIWKEEISSSIRRRKKIEIPKCEDGNIYFKLISLTDNSFLYDAEYVTETSNTSNIKIALNICTYKREKYLLHNLEVIKEKFLNNPASELYKKMEVFITDNGKTLDINAFQRDSVHIVHNPNYGGTGGFTRGLLEIEKKKKDLKITHVIFMDDDVMVEPESIRRTYVLLRLLKDNYKNSFIAGAMLRLDKPYIQYENGAAWNEGKCRFFGRGVDLRDFENVVVEEDDYLKDYAAWWYCCMSINVVRKNNLPLPIFIHEDDVEYSLRNAEHIITMNGIAIWHEASEHRRVSANEYYNLRNMLIVNAIYSNSYDAVKVKKQVFTAMIIAVLRYRYRDMELIKMAVKDFCKGPKWLMKIDAEEYHKFIVKNGYLFQDIGELLENKNVMIHHEENLEGGFKYRIKNANNLRQICKYLFQIISLNGYFLPAKKEIHAYYMNVHPIQIYRINNLLLFDESDNKGIILRRSQKQLLAMVKLLIETIIIIDLKYKNSCREYKNSFKNLTSHEYWKGVLLDDDTDK